jgi:hypothetical protein
VRKLASTRADARFWVIATRIENTCEGPVSFDLWSGEDPWLGLYRSSDGDVGWTPAGLVSHETALLSGEFAVGGFYDLGNPALGQADLGFSNQANFIEIDPAAPAPDRALFANRFAHAAREVEPERPLDNRTLTALNLGWTGRRLARGEALTIAYAMGMATTGMPGEVPRPPEVTDEDWSLWRRYLAGRGDREEIEFAAERVDLALGATRLDLDAVYTLVNPGRAGTGLTIVYPVLVGAARPAPDSVEIDGRRVALVAAGADRVAATFPIEVPPLGIRRFRVRYSQAHRTPEAVYLVTSARRWPAPIGRAVFTVRSGTEIRGLRLSLPAASRRLPGGETLHVVHMQAFRPSGELVLRWQAAGGGAR